MDDLPNIDADLTGDTPSTLSEPDKPWRIVDDSEAAWAVRKRRSAEARIAGRVAVARTFYERIEAERAEVDAWLAKVTRDDRDVVFVKPLDPATCASCGREERVDASIVSVANSSRPALASRWAGGDTTGALSAFTSNQQNTAVGLGGGAGGGWTGAFGTGSSLGRAGSAGGSGGGGSGLRCTHVGEHAGAIRNPDGSRRVA